MIERQPSRVEVEPAQPAPAREVHHFVEHEGVVQYLHGGKVLKEGSRFHDGFGLEKLRKSVAEEGRELARIYGVTDESTLVVRAVITKRQYSQVVKGVGADPFTGRSRTVYEQGSHRETAPAEYAWVVWSSDGREAQYQEELGGKPI